ncbi:MAG: outer membrane protein assembly factor BamD [Thermodesulfobacteriota bacterium]
MNESNLSLWPAVRIAAALVLLLSLLNGCVVLDSAAGVIDRFFGEVDEKTPPELLMDGQEYLEAGRYQSAAEAFQQITDRYPYSPQAIRAELLMADAVFKREDYALAYELYDEFERLHPRNENVPFVIYRKGMCHLERVSTIDRDQTHTRAARDEFERLVRQFPEDRYAKLARIKIRKCLIYLAEYELYVGHFYFKRGDFRAAMGRYQYIIRNYPDMGQYHEALEYIRICQEKLAEEEAEHQEEPEEISEAEEEVEEKEEELETEAEKS